MKIRYYILLILILFAASGASEAHHGPAKEYQVKAAFLYNFIKFVEWPEQKATGSGDTITIGVIGKNHLGKALEPITKKAVKGKRIAVKQFESFEELRESNKKLDDLKKCRLVFIDSSQKENSKAIIEALKGSSVLTVGEFKGFVENGGVINLLMEDKKVKFTVNISAAERAELKIRSQLLKLAKRVVKEKPVKDTKS